MDNPALPPRFDSELTVRRSEDWKKREEKIFSEKPV
jgi:hypothetical protein